MQVLFSWESGRLGGNSWPSCSRLPAAGKMSGEAVQGTFEGDLCGFISKQNRYPGGYRLKTAGKGGSGRQGAYRQPGLKAVASAVPGNTDGQFHAAFGAVGI